MTATVLKSTIKKQISFVEDENVLRSIHAMLTELLLPTNNGSLLSKAQKQELDKTIQEHKSGKLSYYTLDQAKSKVYKKYKK